MASGLWPRASGKPVRPERRGHASPRDSQGAAAKLRIRTGAPADARACAAVMRAAIRAVSPAVHPRRALLAWSRLPSLYHRWAMGPGGETYLLAERAGRLLGYAAVRGAELTAVFVRPAAQGQGVGRALALAVARRVRRAGHRRLRVLAARAAVPFYAALGFRGAGRARVPLPGGLTLDAVQMSLLLAGAER